MLPIAQIASNLSQSAVNVINNNAREAARQRRAKLLVVAVHLCMEEKKGTESFKSRLNLQGRLGRGRGLKRAPLAGPKQSRWQKSCGSKDDAASITATGMDHEAFSEVLKFHSPHFETLTPWTGKQDGTTHRRLQRPTKEESLLWRLAQDLSWPGTDSEEQSLFFRVGLVSLTHMRARGSDLAEECC